MSDFLECGFVHDERDPFLCFDGCTFGQLWFTETFLRPHKENEKKKEVALESAISVLVVAEQN